MTTLLPNDLNDEFVGPPIHEFTCDVNPVPWKEGSLGVKRFGGKVRPYLAPNAEMVAYKEALREAWQPMWTSDPIEDAVILSWRFHRCLMTYTSAKGRKVTKHRADLTNIIKSSEDALQPWLIKNDVQVIGTESCWLEQGRDVSPGVSLYLTVVPEYNWMLGK